MILAEILKNLVFVRVDLVNQTITILETLQLQRTMRDVIFLTEQAINLFDDLGALTDHLVFNQQMAAHGMYTGGNGPQMDIVNSFYPLYT